MIKTSLPANIKLNTPNSTAKFILTIHYPKFANFLSNQKFIICQFDEKDKFLGLSPLAEYYLILKTNRF